MMQFFLALLFLSFPVMAAPYQVNYDDSQIQFSATHAGNEFAGRFETWHADINFDGDDLEKSSVVVIFNMASAKTGNPMYDGTLPTADWFNSENHPEAKFQSTSLIENGDAGYSVTGDLTIRNMTHPITFDFILNGDNPTIMTAEFPIDRLKYDIGKDSDGDAEWVSQIIVINLEITANY